LTCAFPKPAIAWLAWIALIPLLAALRNQSPKTGFLLGLSAGFAHYLTLMYWVSGTMRTFGHLPWALCIAVLILFSGYLSLFLAGFSAALLHICRTPLRLLVGVPALWVSVDYLRSFLFTGFPWELIGYSQYKSLHLIQHADLFGVYGVSFWIVGVNATVFLLLLGFFKLDWNGRTVSKKLAAGSIAAAFLVSAMIWEYGSWRIKQVDQAVSRSGSVRVTVVQGNIAQPKKWDLAFQDETVDIYLRLSCSARGSSPDLVVWPETATPFYFFNDKKLTEKVLNGIGCIAADFLIGSPSFELREDSTRFYNSAYLLDTESKVLGKYDKVHLVPFGEYVPLKKWLPFLGKIVEQVGDFEPGERGRTLSWNGTHLGVQICYEIIFPELSRTMARNKAAFLVNLTNDAWYGYSSAPYQHFSMTIFRAVENRRPLIRSANTGISGFVDPAGRVLMSSPLFKEAVLTCSLPVLDQTTWYTRYGNVFAATCLLGIAALVLARTFFPN